MNTVKLFEVRDAGTFIPVMCIECKGDSYLMRRAGFVDRMILLVNMNSWKCAYFLYDPYDRLPCARTIPQAHQYIEEHWSSLVSGQVIDVQFILGETTTCKESEETRAN